MTGSHAGRLGRTALFAAPTAAQWTTYRHDTENSGSVAAMRRCGTLELRVDDAPGVAAGKIHAA